MEGELGFDFWERSCARRSGLHKEGCDCGEKRDRDGRGCPTENGATFGRLCRSNSVHDARVEEGWRLDGAAAIGVQIFNDCKVRCDHVTATGAGVEMTVGAGGEGFAVV